MNYILQNVVGHTVKTGELTEGRNEIDMSAISAGIYRIQIEGKDGFINKKVIIIK